MYINDSHFHSTLMSERGVNLSEALSNMTSGLDLGAVPGDIDQRRRLLGSVLGADYSGKSIRFAAGSGPWCLKDAPLNKLCETLESELDKSPDAVGETGFDFFTCPGISFDEQKKLFEFHFNASQRAGLPLVVHTRNAWKETTEFFSSHKAGNAPVIIHCFSGSSENALAMANMGFYVAFGGAATYKNNTETLMATRAVPLDKLLLETDAPFLPPQGMRGTVNTPLNLEHIVPTIAAAVGVTSEELAKICNANLERVFS